MGSANSPWESIWTTPCSPAPRSEKVQILTEKKEQESSQNQKGETTHRADDPLRLTKYLQTNSLTNTARRMLPMTRKILKASKSSTSDPSSCAGFSLANWPRSFMASSKRDRYFCRPRRGEPLWSSDRRSPRGLCLRPPMSSSREPPRCSPRLGSGEPLLSGVALCERLPCSETSG